MKVLKTLAVLTMVVMGFPGMLYAGWTITQTIQLKAGWNAVFLEVNPADPKPDAVFKDLPVDKVLTYYPQASSVQFIQDPNEIPYNTAGWNFWVSLSTPGNFLKNLHAIHANQPYLIRATQDVQWQLAGTPKAQSYKWQPNGFNFTGFHVNPDAPPTFTGYLGNAPAFSDSYIFYLQNGQWTKGKNTETIGSGQAYWIFCKGGSQFKGPVEIKLPSPGENLSFTPETDELSIEFINRYATPITFTIEQISNPTEDPAVPLSLANFTPETGKTYTPFTSYTHQTPLETDKNITIRFAVRRGEITVNEVKSILKISDSVGGMMYVPVRAEK